MKALVHRPTDRPSEGGMEDDSCSRRPRLGDNWMRERGREGRREGAVQWRESGRTDYLSVHDTGAVRVCILPL